MKIEEISVKNIIIDNIRNLYESAFPRDERRDFEDFKSLLAAPKSHFSVYAFFEDDVFAGFASCWRWDGFCYLEHFAVEERMRNGGRGARYLSELVRRMSLPMIIEVEPPEDDLSRRRIGFYERNGFRLAEGIDYVQPPYSPDRKSMRLMLMTYGDICLTGDEDDRILRIKADVYGVTE
ncbi:MAG: GNAT family N-acetyltransferase [Candidatus Limisoma sp.]